MFTVAKPQNAFNLDGKDGQHFLFLFGGEGPNGHDITLRKQNNVNGSYCSRIGGCYNYPGFPNVKTVLRIRRSVHSVP